MSYIIRKQCIFCNNNLDDLYFNNDYEIYIGQYAVDLNSDKNTHIKIPFNFYICSNCKTLQNKYLGNLNDIYKINHGDGTAPIVINLHNFVSDIILNNINNINNIIEIGCSCGLLADNILNKINNVNFEYNIIEPSFIGDPKNKIIYNNYYENVDDKNINANTLIMSHVFEHFYEPRKILDKISENNNIKYIYLINPDMEYCIKNNVYHVLNTEHTYYIDNNFIIQLFNLYNFKLIQSLNFKNHSIIFIFEKEQILNNNAEYNIRNSRIINSIHFCNEIDNINVYYKKIFSDVNKINTIIENNKDKNIYIWPSSIHFSYMNTFGLNNNISGLLDNSKYKIGKKMYGTDLLISSFNEKILKDELNTIIIMSGPSFHEEIQTIVKKSKNIIFEYI